MDGRTWTRSYYLHGWTYPTPAPYSLYMSRDEGGIEDLPDSRLGTKEYWDSQYEVEIKNLEAHGDEGEVWFGLAAEKRVIEYVVKNYESSSVVVDLGCGNGHFCLSLVERGFSKVFGMDYSERAVQLALNIAQNRNLTNTVSFSKGDLLHPETICPCNAGIVVDKGTFDAVSLGSCEELPQEFSSKTEYFVHLYTLSISRIAAPEHILVITSCNWTLGELKGLFGGCYEFIHQIPQPSFRFGGQQGSTVTTVVFRHLRH